MKVKTRFSFKSFKMNSNSTCCPESCLKSNSIDDCADGHLSSLCPPPCEQCCPDPCSSFNCCPKKVSDYSACQRRYQILKHVVRCPPIVCDPSCRTNYKPVVSCKAFSPCEAMCYETNYMRSYNASCCLPTSIENCEFE